MPGVWLEPAWNGLEAVALQRPGLDARPVAAQSGLGQDHAPPRQRAARQGAARLKAKALKRPGSPEAYARARRDTAAPCPPRPAPVAMTSLGCPANGIINPTRRPDSRAPWGRHVIQQPAGRPAGSARLGVGVGPGRAGADGAVIEPAGRQPRTAICPTHQIAYLYTRGEEGPLRAQRAARAARAARCTRILDSAAPRQEMTRCDTRDYAAMPMLQ